MILLIGTESVFLCALCSLEYKADNARASKDDLVLIMDYAQNLTLPHAPDTPSSWYFLSLVAVSLFGVFCANDNLHYHYVYSERKGGKGPNEVTSMIHHTLYHYGLFNDAFSDSTVALQGVRTVTVWCDNCGGQNKNSYIVWYLLFLVQSGIVREAQLKFFQKGHTKNACDRGFGSVKKHLARESCWNMAGLVEAVSASATSSNAINLDLKEHPFWDFKTGLAPRYKKVQGIQSYQLFRITREKPGHVECRRTPSSEPKWIDLRSEPLSDDLASARAFADAWSSIQNLKDPPPNPEKMSDINKKVLPFVPAKYATDPMYQKPSDEVERQAMEIKRIRRQSVAANAKKKRKRKQVDDNEEEKEGVCVGGGLCRS